MAVVELEVGDVPLESSGRRVRVEQVEHPRPAQDLDGLPAVATRVHPHRPADRAGDPHVELQARQAPGGRPAGQHGKRHGPTGADDA